MQSKKQLVWWRSIKGKLFLAFSVLIFLVVVQAYIGVTGLSQMNERLNNLAEVSALEVKLANSISQLALSISRSEKNIILATSDEEMDKLLRAANVFRDEIGKNVAELRPLLDEQGQSVLDDFNAVWNDYLTFFNEVFKLAKNRNNEEAFSLSAGKARELNDRAQSKMSSLVTKVEADMAADVKLSDENFVKNRNLQVALSLLGIAGGVLTALFVVFGITNALKKLQNALSDIAQGEGDLTVKLSEEAHDETGQLAATFNLFVQKLRVIIIEMTNAITQIATAAEELSIVSSQSSNDVAKQKCETELVATAMNEMVTTIQEVSRNTASASGAAGEANKSAISGNELVTDAIDSINILAKDIDTSVDAIEVLKGHSENIGRVLDVIKNIADQINLLALNAAIEAARAGEQGRGFSVVADEVRTLAQRTQGSTSEIEELIVNLQKGTMNTVDMMELNQERANETVQRAIRAGEALKSIIDAVTSIQEMNFQIAAASEQQSTVSEDINQKLVAINDIATQSSAAVEQTSASSDEVARLGNQLQGLVQQFKV